MTAQQEKPTLFYVFDALCGWCYGFSPVIQEFKRIHEADFNFRVLSGGMVTGERVGPISTVASYIKEAYLDVEERTGTKFGEEFIHKLMNDSQDIFTSVPPAMALALFRTQQPENEIEFASRMQSAIYYQGLPPGDWATYGQCASDFGINAEEFAKKLQSEKLFELAQKEFQVVSNWGIKGFPSVLLQKNDQAYLIARGYSDLNDLEETAEKVLEEINSKS